MMIRDRSTTASGLTTDDQRVALYKHGCHLSFEWYEGVARDVNIKTPRAEDG